MRAHFGTYADGGAIGGSLNYKGANGLKLSDVKDFSFTFNYKQAGNLTGAAPYARIFLDTDGDHTTDADVILDPSLGGRVLPVQGADINFGTADDSVRYDDDAGAAPSSVGRGQVCPRTDVDHQRARLPGLLDGHGRVGDAEVDHVQRHEVQLRRGSGRRSRRSERPRRRQRSAATASPRSSMTAAT